MKLRLRPEEKTELVIISLGMLATYAVQELTALAVRWHVQAHDADEDVTRLKANNDQLQAHNAELLDAICALRDNHDADQLPPHED